MVLSFHLLLSRCFSMYLAIPIDFRCLLTLVGDGQADCCDVSPNAAAFLIPPTTAVARKHVPKLAGTMEISGTTNFVSCLSISTDAFWRRLALLFRNLLFPHSHDNSFRDLSAPGPSLGASGDRFRPDPSLDYGGLLWVLQLRPWAG